MQLIYRLMEIPSKNPSVNPMVVPIAMLLCSNTPMTSPVMNAIAIAFLVEDSFDDAVELDFFLTITITSSNNRRIQLYKFIG
jgi:hypothetical protein